MRAGTPAPDTAAELAKKTRQVRGRKLTALKRTLGALRDAVAEADGVLGGGSVPADGILAKALKYDQARTEILLLDSLTAPGEDPEDSELSEDDLITPELRMDLALMVLTILSSPEVGGITPGTSLDRLATVAFPEGMDDDAIAAVLGAQDGQVKA